MSHEHHHHDCEGHCHEHHHEHGGHHEHEHSHEHHHHHEEGDMKSQILKIIIATILLIIAVVIEHTCNLATWKLLLIYLIPYLYIGNETIKEAIEGLVHGEALNEDFLMTIATVGALCIGFLPGAETQFPEAVFVMLFFQVGELFEGYAEGRSRESISHLMDIRPDVANVERNGETQQVSPENVEVGETIIVRPGEKIPLDGIILEGNTTLNTVALTGESVPREANANDEVISGCINLTGLIRVRTTKSFGESTVSKIINLVENASESKSKTESFITRFAKVYTPIVVGVAVVLAIVPPLFSGSFADTFSTWLLRALTFLVVSCPCALVISVPLTFFGGIGGASRNGILIKGSNFMDVLAKVDTIVFDKTGTLTKGTFAVDAIHPEGISADELLHLAADVERYSTHPIANALREACRENIEADNVSDIEEIAGHGVRAKVNGQTICVGNRKMMSSIGAEAKDCDSIGTIIHVAVEGKYAGHIVISDQVKSDSAEAIKALKSLGISKTVMLTGDRNEVGQYVAQQLGLDECHTELLPTDKVAEVERLIASKPAGKSLAFVGDGINDAPVLARADVGIAMGGLGSDAAIEAADVVLMNDEPSKIAKAISISRRTKGIAYQNTWFAIGVKIAVLILATFGLANMWMAVFADVGVCVLAVLNAMRALKS